MKAKNGVKILKAAAKVVSKGKHGTCGQVAVGAGQVMVLAECDESQMIAEIGELKAAGGLLIGDGEVQELDRNELSDWLTLAGPLMKSGLGREELTFCIEGEDQCAVQIGAKRWPITSQKRAASDMIGGGEPPSPLEPEVAFTITPAALLEAIEQVSGCTALKDDSRPVLRWVHMLNRDGRVLLEAANGFFLAQSRVDNLSLEGARHGGADCPGIDWAQFGPLIKALLEVYSPHIVEVQVKGDVICILGMYFTITITAQGKFPDTAQIIPAKMIGAEDALLLDVAEILDALPEARMQTEYGPSKGTNGVMLYTADGQTLEVSGLVPDTSAVKWGVFVNGKYLETLLKSSGCDLLQVKWDYAHPAGMIVLADDGDWLGVLMPLSQYGSDGGGRRVAGIPRPAPDQIGGLPPRKRG